MHEHDGFGPVGRSRLTDKGTDALYEDVCRNNLCHRSDPVSRVIPVMLTARRPDVLYRLLAARKKPSC